MLDSGSQFVMDGGLAAVGTTVVGSGVLVETTVQTLGQVYELFVDTSIQNNFGVGLDANQNDATFTGFDSGPVEHCGIIDTDQTWAAVPSGHLVTCDVIVQGPSSPTLSIDDGAVISFETGTGLYVGMTQSGNLIAQGSAVGVEMLPAAAIPSPGAWTGIVIGPQAALVSITGLNVGSATVGVNVQAADVSLDQVSISASQFDGLWANGSGTVAVTDSEISENGGNGLLCDSSPCLAADFVGNVVTNNALNPISLSTAVDVGRLDTSSSFAGNGSDYIRVRGSTSINVDATWIGHDVGLQLEGDLTISAGAMLNISDMAVRFEGSSTAYGIHVMGLSSMQADSSVFSSSPESNGAWLGVDFDSGASGSLTNSSILYGGSPDAVTLGSGTTISVIDNHIAHSNGFGILCEGGCGEYGGTISGNTFEDNPSGDISP